MGVLRVGGARLYFHTAGRGEPLLLLHGLGSSGRDWEEQIAEFSSRYEVIAPDFRGFGGSERAGDYRVERFAADIWALVEHLQLGRPSVLGYSMGGAVAMQMALDQPGRIPRMVLSNTLPSFRTDTPAKRLLLWTRLFLMSVLGPQRLSKVITRKLFPHPDQARLREKVAQRSSRNDRWVYLRTVRALVRWSVRHRLHELAMPVLVLAAEHDYFSGSEVRAFVDALPDARLKIFPGTRHGLPLEQPGAYNRAVLEFLEA
jgi:3-oxoadipate enol-lactonase